ncbi:MAG: DUF5688 family protein [Lachnospiraceae bacterium]
MDYQQFVRVVEQEVKGNAGTGVRVQLHTVMKNNGKERVGLAISEEKINISPTIYLEEYFEKFRQGREISNIVESILQLYEEVRFEHSWEGKYVRDFEKVKKQVVYKVINYKKNAELLNEIPYVGFLDLAVVFYVLLELNQHGTATMTIRNEHLKGWGVSREELLKAAQENTVRLLPAEFKTMKTVLEEMLTLNIAEDTEDYMYVLSNPMKNFGACCILYDGILEKIGNRLGGNYYILPSSVHEVIIIPENQSPEKKELRIMITEINETQVAEEEILSNVPYYYVREKKQLFL